MNTSTTNKRITDDPVKMTIVERLVKEGHISLDEGLILLHETVSVITYHSTPDRWKPLIPEKKPDWLIKMFGDSPLNLKSPRVQEYILNNAKDAMIPA